MNDTAIQKDAEEVMVVGNVERNRIMEDIAARAREERDKELAANDHPVVDTSGKEAPKEEKEEEKEEKEEEKEEKEEENVLKEENKASEEVKEEPKEELKEEPKPETVKIKVDGEEREVPKDKIVDAGIRTLQKESTADKRLEEATRLLREVKERIAPPKEEEAPSQQWDDATVAYALEHGTEEQKAYAVKQLRGRDTATPEEVEQKVMHKVLDTMDFKEASTWFVSEYKDVVGDPYLLQLASIAETNLRSNGDTRSRKELYKDIGDELRRWKGGATATQTFEEKRTEKSKIVNIPSASVKKVTEQDKPPKTTADIIEEMRKRRGQK